MFNYLLPYQHLLTNPQKMDLAKAIQMNSQFHIKPTKTQSGGFLGALLASIGVPLALNVIKSLTGKGVPRIGAPLFPPKSGKGHQLIQPSPPFVGTWDQIHGKGKKNNSKRKRIAPRQNKKMKKGFDYKNSIKK